MKDYGSDEIIKKILDEELNKGYLQERRDYGRCNPNPEKQDIQNLTKCQR